MSEVIIKMEKPEHCGYCRFRYDGICHALQKTQYSQEDCPLVHVPPHGRLIDADALASEMEKQIQKQDELMELCKSAGDTKNYFNTSRVQIGMVSFLRALNDAPTIIPAEEGER